MPNTQTRKWITSRLSNIATSNAARRSELEAYDTKLRQTEHEMEEMKRHYMILKASRRKIASTIKKNETIATDYKLRPPKDMVDCMGEAGGSMFGSLPAELIVMIVVGFLGFEAGFFRGHLYLVSKAFRDALLTPFVLKKYNEWKIRYTFWDCRDYQQMIELRWMNAVDMDTHPKYFQIDYGAYLASEHHSVVINGNEFYVNHFRTIKSATQHPIHEHFWFIRLANRAIVVINTTTKQIYTSEWIKADYILKTKTQITLNVIRARACCYF
jgi:hypothetical protein